MTLKTASEKLTWVLLRLVELSVAAFMVFLFTAYLQQREDTAFEDIEPTDWFEVNEVFVPDHGVGDNPRMLYDREIKEDFRGFWVVEVQRLGGPEESGSFFNACSGSGTADYDEHDYLDEDLVTWQWFIGRPCEVGPGTYRLVITYDMRHPEYPNRVKRYRALSNVFTVS